MTETENSDDSNAPVSKVEESSTPYLRFPEPSAPLAPSHRLGTISLVDYLDEIEPQLRRFLRDHDRPEDRLARKIPERFVWDI